MDDSKKGCRSACGKTPRTTPILYWAHYGFRTHCRGLTLYCCTSYTWMECLTINAPPYSAKKNKLKNLPSCFSECARFPLCWICEGASSQEVKREGFATSITNNLLILANMLHSQSRTSWTIRRLSVQGWRKCEVGICWLKISWNPNLNTFGMSPVRRLLSYTC